MKAETCTGIYLWFIRFGGEIISREYTYLGR